jgi:hypothetical protein
MPEKVSPAIDLLDILAHRAIDRANPPREDEAHDHRARDHQHGHDRQAPVQRQQHADRDEEPDERDRRRDDRTLEEAGRRIHVARQTGEDAAGLHLPQLGQREMEQAVEERAPQRQHHLRVQQTLAVIACHADQRRHEDDREEGEAGQVQAIQSRGGIDRRIQQDAIDDEPHEERLDHLQPGADEREQEQRRHPIAMWPQPTQVLAEILTTLAAEQRRLGVRNAGLDTRPRLDRPLAARLVRTVVKPPVLIVADEVSVTLS